MLIFLDVETTGLEFNDKICSIAIILKEDEQISSFYELVNEGKKIPPQASSINHLTNEMLKDKPKLVDSNIYDILQKNNLTTTTIIGHNVKFDLEMLSRSGFKFLGYVIDTLRVTKHLIPECELFSLQFLRYELRLYRVEKEYCEAHNAMGDASVIKNLYEYLLDIAPIEMLKELSFKMVLMQKLEFGKYSGRHIEEIAMIDRGYLEWMFSNVVDLDEDLRYSIKYYL